MKKIILLALLFTASLASFAQTKPENTYSLSVNLSDSIVDSTPLSTDVDTTDIEDMFEYAELCRKQGKFAESLKCYKICKKLCLMKDDIVNLVTIQNNLGLLYMDCKDYVTSEDYLMLALENYEGMFSRYPDTFREDIAATQNNLGRLFVETRDYEDSEKYYKSALDNKEYLFKQDTDKYRGSLFETCWRMMELYERTNDTIQYYVYVQKSHELCIDLYKSQPDLYIDYLIQLKNRTVWGLLEEGKTSEALEMAKTNLAIDETDVYLRYYLAECYKSEALDYTKSSSFKEAHASIDKAISLCPKTPGFYDTKGEIFLMQKKKKDALRMWNKVIELFPKILEQCPEGTTLSRGLRQKGLI